MFCSQDFMVLIMTYHQEWETPLTLSEGQVPYPNWLEYVYRTAHPTLRWLPTKLAEWILCPIGGRLPKNGLFKTSLDDLLYHLIFFNTFEVLKLPIKGPMEDAGVIKLYEQSPTPCLYVAPVENIMGGVPLFLLFLAGNSTPWLIVPHCYSKHKDSGFPRGCADSAAVDGRCGSNALVVAVWTGQVTTGWTQCGGNS